MGGEDCICTQHHPDANGCNCNMRDNCVHDHCSVLKAKSRKQIKAYKGMEPLFGDVWISKCTFIKEE